MAGHVIHVHETIPAPPEQVWEVVTDVGHYDRILRSVSGSALTTEGGFDVGTTWHERRTIFGHHGEEELHVVECDAPRRAMVETRLGHDVVRTSYSLTPAGGHDRGTRLAMTTSAEMRDRTPVGSLAWRFFGGFSYEATRRMLRHDLEDIVAEVVRRSATRV